MRSDRYKEIISHVEAQFAPIRNALGDEHIKDLREAQFRARKTNNSGAMLPVEAASYIAHAKALVVARAKCIAEAYTAFNEPAGREATDELTSFFTQTVGGRKSAFHGMMEQRRMATHDPMTQLTFILHGFDRDTHPALDEARAILDMQRVQMVNKPSSAEASTKYAVDTSVFNWLAESKIKKSSLPSDGGFAITHVQVDEINETNDKEKRARLVLIQTALACKLLPTQTFLADFSRPDHARHGDGRLFTALKHTLDILNGNKKNNSRDALIAEAAIAKGLTLLTADGDLKSATEKHGGKVMFFKK